MVFKALDHILSQNNNSIPNLKGSSKLSEAIHLGRFAQEVYSFFRAHQAAWYAERSYTMSINSDDMLYPDIQRWLISRLPSAEQKALSALSRYERDDEDGEISISLRYYYNGNRTLSTILDGHRVKVDLIREAHDDEKGKLVKLSTANIIFTTQSSEGQQAVTALLERLCKERVRKLETRVMVTTSWGDWVQAKSLHVRNPETVVLADGQMDMLSEDVGRFLEDEQWYGDRGIPWHRGYLLFGPPGTGKTSAALALAFIHRLDVYALSLSDIKSDTDLIKLVSSVKNRSLLLLEDIDTVHAAREREGGDGDTILSAQGLYNALDGAVTPHGLITVMTTNKYHKLDPALIRTGRCDVKAEIGYLTDSQLSRMVEVMTGTTGPLPSVAGKQIAAVDIMECIKSNSRDMAAARRQIIATLEGHKIEEAA